MSKFVRLSYHKKTLPLPTHEYIILKFHDPNKRKKGLYMLRADTTFEWYEDPMVFRVFVYIFLFGTNGKNGHLDENDVHTVLVVFLKMSF